MSKEENQQLSRLLFNGREIAAMYKDVVRENTGKEDAYLKRFIEETDAYRSSKGWDINGYGKEAESS